MRLIETMNKYQKLRSDISDIANNEGIAKFYSGAIFGHTSWYTSSHFEKPEAIRTSVEVPEQKVETIIERPSAEESPSRNEVLKSLAKKVEESGPIQSKFGNIVKDSKSTSLGSNLKLSADLENYKEMVEKFNPSFRFEDFQGVSTLIVGESRIDELNDETSHIKTKHDNSELLGKMIIPMKLEEGEFVRSSLIGKTDDEVLQNILSEIYLLRPKVVISLGAVATNFLYGKKEKLSKIHGNEIERVIENEKELVNFTLFPIFHPDLLEINPSMKRTAWMDLQKVMKFLGKL